MLLLLAGALVVGACGLAVAALAVGSGGLGLAAVVSGVIAWRLLDYVGDQEREFRRGENGRLIMRRPSDFLTKRRRR